MEQIIRQAVSGKIDRVNVDAFCAAAGIDVFQLCNDIALEVAKRFDSGTMSHEDGDNVMNTIVGLMTDDDAAGHPLAEPAWSIYEAFDDGRNVRRYGADPVGSYTRPTIRGLLKRQEAENIFASGDANEIASALIDIALHDRDWCWVQNKCLGFARDGNPVVRQAAVTCLGHVARIHRELDLETVLAVLNELSGDPAVTTEDALDDIRIFIRNAAP